MAAPPYIQIRDLTKKFGNHTVLDNVSMNFPFGEITGVIGVSGSGKTTLLNLLIGFIKPTSGEILFQSRNIFKDMKNVQNIFGFGTQIFSFYDDLTVEENLMYFGHLYKLDKKFLKKKVDELLELVELDYARKTLARDLSSGMSRRLDIACALIHSPKVLILDEPTQDLDILLRRELIKTLKKIRSTANTTMIITSHLLDEMDYLCDKIAILNNNDVVEFGTPAQIKKKYGKNNLNDVFEFIIKKKITLKDDKKKKDSKSKKPADYEDILDDLEINKM